MPEIRPKPEQDYQITVIGSPVPWTVYTKRGKPPAAFLAMQAWQETIRAAVIQKYGRPMLSCPVELTCTFYCILPGPKTDNLAIWGGRAWTALTRKPDLTNYLKALEDGLKGMLLSDDSVVVRVHATKCFARPGVEPWTSIKVRPLRFKDIF